MKVRVKAGRVFELRVDVTGYLEGELKDWPANIQDVIYASMESLLAKQQVKELYVVQSRCGRDDVTEPYHIVVVVCEILRPVLLQ